MAFQMSLHPVMLRGGNQLAEMIDRAYDYRTFETSMREFGLNIIDLDFIKAWLECKYDYAQAVQMLGNVYRTTAASNLKYLLNPNHFFFKKICRRLVLRPMLDARGAIANPYSFLKYDDYMLEDGIHRVITTDINLSTFWRAEPTSQEKKWLRNVYVYRRRDGVWRRAVGKYAADYKKAYLKIAGIIEQR